MCMGKVILYICVHCGIVVDKTFRVTTKCAPVKNGRGPCTGEQKTGSEDKRDSNCGRHWYGLI